MKRALLFVLFGLSALVLTAALAIFLIARLVLAPDPGEWAGRAQVGPLGVDVGVPTALRLATSHWFAPRLDGHALKTRFGPVALAWNASANALEMRCAPCSATLPALGAQPIKVDRLLITVRRDVNVLAGAIEATPPSGGASDVLRARWEGRLSQRALELSAEAPEAPIATWYAVLAPHLPELRRARIQGTLALRAQLALPARRFAVQPRIAGFTVSGLGTEALLGARTGCGAPSRLGNESWLARAVIAAEDPRFFQHAGFDLAELGAAFEANQDKGAVARGGSTLTQQLARIVITGSERSAERKLLELLYAADMEQTLGKARILQLYLDNAPWGEALCGAEAAAQRYFKRSAARLEPAQAVWLAAMLHNPAMEAERWSRQGQIDVARAMSVAEGIRGIPRGQREALRKALERARLAPP